MIVANQSSCLQLDMHLLAAAYRQRDQHVEAEFVPLSANQVADTRLGHAQRLVLRPRLIDID